MNISNEVNNWFHNALYQLALQRKAAFIQELCVWIVDIIQYQYRYEIEWIDAGYDCSSQAKCTHEGYNINDYQMVSDFLQECNGNTYPTFISGMGLATETFEEDLERQVEAHYYKLMSDLVKSLYTGEKTASASVIDYISTINVQDEEDWRFENELVFEPLEMICWELLSAFIEEFKQMDMRFVYQSKHVQLATQNYLKQVDLYQQCILQKQQDDAIAQRVDRYFTLLCPIRTKLEMSQKTIAIETLKKLPKPPQNLTIEEIWIYLTSDYFSARMSKKLLNVCQDTFRINYGV